MAVDGLMGVAEWTSGYGAVGARDVPVITSQADNERVPDKLRSDENDNESLSSPSSLLPSAPVMLRLQATEDGGAQRAGASPCSSTRLGLGEGRRVMTPSVRRSKPLQLQDGQG